MTSPNSAVIEKRKYSSTSGYVSIGLAFSEKGKPISLYSSLMNSEQLPAVSGDIHGKDYVRQAVHGFHVAVCRDPCHFCGWLRDCPSAKAYLVLVDFSGRE